MLVFGKSQAFLCVPTYLLTKLALFYIQRFILFEKVEEYYLHASGSKPCT